MESYVTNGLAIKNPAQELTQTPVNQKNSKGTGSKAKVRKTGRDWTRARNFFTLLRFQA